MVWSVSERLFYGGLAVMAAAAVLTVIFLVVFSITGKRIREKLEREYGAPMK